MMPKLFAARYDDTDYTGTNPVETFQDVEDIGLRWNILKGGIQRIELTIRPRSDMDAYDRYVNHHGQLIAIYDSYCDKYLAGNIYEVIPNGRNVTYVCGGPSHRLNDDWYGLADFDVTIPTDDTNVVIKDILTDSVATVDSDQSNIDSSGIDIGAWIPWRTSNVSKNAGEAIFELSKMGKSDGSLMDFYIVDQPFSGVELQKPLAYFKARSATADPDWIFGKKDIAAGGLTMARHIWNLRRKIWISAGRLSGTHTGAGSSHLIDSGGAFEASGVALGDTVINVTTANSWTVEAFVDPANDDEIDMVNAPGSPDEWTNGDHYSIQLRNPKWSNTSTSTETDLWSVYHAENHMEFDTTQRDEYGNVLLALYEKPVLQQAFVLSAPYIHNGNGARSPLWRPLMGDSFYFRVNDLFPAAAVFGASDDREQTFLAVAMDYTYRDNRLRIVPATGDSRLDVLLAQALSDKRTIGEIISTAGSNG